MPSLQARIRNQRDDRRSGSLAIAGNQHITPDRVIFPQMLGPDILEGRDHPCFLTKQLLGCKSRGALCWQLHRTHPGGHQRHSHVYENLVPDTFLTLSSVAI